MTEKTPNLFCIVKHVRLIKKETSSLKMFIIFRITQVVIYRTFNSLSFEGFQTLIVLARSRWTRWKINHFFLRQQTTHTKPHPTPYYNSKQFIKLLLFLYRICCRASSHFKNTQNVNGFSFLLNTVKNTKTNATCQI